VGCARVATYLTQSAEGFSALLVLRNRVDPLGLDTILALLDAFPDAVVEFATFDVGVGVYHQPTVIFEVREY